ncbi:dienelactone hydrolase family protein [Dactylosporangium sp. CA-139114]|uniref:dienelactone hydrolase family protein n=1 Tax=Dactylosporangium sp. CA-139114 TaxID=3239931 RepID=UPI003D998B30
MSTAIKSAGAALDADVTVPPDSRGLVLFAHGSGSSRLSPRNRMVAERLNGVGLATVLTDLLTPDEDASALDARFDIGLLGERLTGVADWIAGLAVLGRLPLGLFGASTGAAAALLTAAERPGQVRAVVSRGGRPDLAGPRLPEVTAPVLLIVGERDEAVLELNRAADRGLGGESALWVVPGATHLFSEPGTLGEVAGAAAQWFVRHLAHAELNLDDYLPDA